MDFIGVADAAQHVEDRVALLKFHLRFGENRAARRNDARPLRVQIHALVHCRVAADGDEDLVFALLRRLVLRILLGVLLRRLLGLGVLVFFGRIVRLIVLFLIGIRLLRVLDRLLDRVQVRFFLILRLADALAHAALRAGWTARVRLQRHFLLRLVRGETLL